MYLADISAPPDSISVEMDMEWIKLEKNSEEIWTAGDIEVFFGKISRGVDISLIAQSISVKRIMLSWKHDLSGEVKILGDHWERGYGDLEWRGIVPERVMPWYFMVNDGIYTYGYGIKTGSGAMCFWQVSKNYIALYLDIRCGDTGVALGGRKLDVASIISFRSDEKPFTATKDFCRLLCHDPIIPSYQIYGGNNWYYAYGESSHKEIMEDSKRISDWAVSSDNRPFMVIDDGWQLCHNGKSVDGYNGGPWYAGNSKFPDMPKLATEMSECGVKPGIWFRPLFTAEKVHESLLLKRTANDLYLDPSVDQVLEKVAQDVERIVSWGFQLIKHDFSTFDIFGRWGFQMQSELTQGKWAFSDRSRTTAEIILELYRTIRKAANNVHIIGCNTVGHLAAGIFDIQRTGDDTSGREWERTRKMGINTLAFRMPQHGTFFAVDADCVGITEHIPWEMNSQWLQLLAQSGTPLFVSASPDALGKKQIDAIKSAFESASKPSPVAEPIDWMETTCPSKWFLNGNIVEFNWHK